MKLPYGLDIFAQGATPYLDYYPDDKYTGGASRIVLNVYLADHPISVVIDTGAPWCVIDPAEINKINNQVSLIHKLDIPFYIRGTAYTGRLYHVPIRLQSSMGVSLDIESTTFVPDLPTDEEWPHPNFIGLDGFLNRIRFAVDPAKNLFFFGELR